MNANSFNYLFSYPLVETKKVYKSPPKPINYEQYVNYFSKKTLMSTFQGCKEETLKILSNATHSSDN